jgi:hypothetical protein
MVAAMSYAVCVNFVDFYRIPADALGSSNVGMKDNQVAKDDIEAKQMDPTSGKIMDGAGVVEVEKMEQRT